MKNNTQASNQDTHLMRVNGSVHVNHIEAKHGSIDFVKKMNAALPQGLRCMIFHNEDRYSSVSSVIISIYGEMNTSHDAKWFRKWATTLVDTMGAPVESALFDILISSPTAGNDESHYFVFSLDDGKLHPSKLIK